ncbi:MAG TPA: hypothetical protein VFU15_16825 [Bacteroidia bacterium]|nr:hypothetical protein [Bacteroidia bacterium]
MENKLSRLTLDGETLGVYLKGNNGILENYMFDIQSFDYDGEVYLNASDGTVIFRSDPSNYHESNHVSFEVRFELEKSAGAPVTGRKIECSQRTKQQRFDFVK